MAENTAPVFATGDGKVFTHFGSGDDTGYSVVVQPDGKVVFAGVTKSTTNAFAMARYNADGTLDTTFGTGGKVVATEDLGADTAFSVVLQPDGKLVLGGIGFNGLHNDFTLLRYNASGKLDETFGVNGIAATSLGPSEDYGQYMVRQPDGKFLLAGVSYSGTSFDFGLVRFDANGMLDTGFATGGSVVTPVGAGAADDFALSVTLQPKDGKILLGGYTDDGTNTKFVLVRYTPTGALDTHFGTNGKVVIPIGPTDNKGFSVAVQSDGKILLGGFGSSGIDRDFVLVRYNADGTPDAGFGNSRGIVRTALNGADEGVSVTIQPDGQILLAGATAGADGGYDFAMARYNKSNGSLDTSFGVGGKVVVPMGVGDDYGQNVTVQADGKILVGGDSIRDGHRQFTLARFNKDGSLDTSFGGTHFTEGGKAVVLDGDASLFDAEHNGAGNYGGATLRLTRAGGVVTDDVFGTSGTLTTDGVTLKLAGITIGSCRFFQGDLRIFFHTDATQARVDAALRQITYANTSDNPADSVKLQWQFFNAKTAGMGNPDAVADAVGLTTVLISGVNDPAVIGGTLQVRLTETNAALTAAGKLTVADVDDPSLFKAGLLAGSLGGKLDLKADGTYGYTASSAHNEFIKGRAYAETFKVTTADGTTETLSIEITGTNDAAVIGGNLAVSLAETDAALTAAGKLTVADVDDPELFKAGTLAGSLGGTLVLQAGGAYAYKASSAHNDFIKGTVHKENFTVTALDGTTQTLSFDLTGTNDAAVIGGRKRVLFTETDAVLTTSGQLTVSDVDDPSKFKAGALEGSLGGSLILQADGSYDYTASSPHDAFARGSKHTETFTVTAADGTTDTVSFEILGTNDAPKFTSGKGAAAAKYRVTENHSTVADLSAKDVDSRGLRYSIDGADSKHFSIDGDTGLLTFDGAPDFEEPDDAGENNVYDVTVKVSDGFAFDTQTLKISVLNTKGVTKNGSAGANGLTGGTEADTLKGLGGKDTLKGGDGDDKLFGGAGGDKLYGGDGKVGEGEDTFVYTKLSDSTVKPAGRDTIYDFQKGDRINLFLIDANTTVEKNQAFTFIGTEDFHEKAGELRYDKKASDTFIYADVNGDGVADFSVRLDDAVKLAKADFLL